MIITLYLLALFALGALIIWRVLTMPDHEQGPRYR